MKIYWKKCFAVLAATPLIACSDDPTVSEEKPPTTVIVQDNISENGGTLSSPGVFTLSAPAFTFPVSTKVTVSRLNDAPADSRVIPNTVLEFKPDSVRLRRSLKLTLSYDPGKVPARMGEASLRVYGLSSEGWYEVDRDTSNAVDMVNHTVRATIGQLGTFAVRSVPVDRIVLSGAQADGAMYVGQRSRIDVTMYAHDYADVFQNAPMRPITWRSSAPTVISVDADGTLSALTTGTAVITATAEGISATSTVTVISARPTANWSRATDWNTYQGNNARNGFVDVVADPATFRERWRRTPATDVISYRQIVSGDGRLFLVTDEGIRKIIALNSSDGTTVWQKSFGTLSAINQGAFRQGIVYFTTFGYPIGGATLFALNAANGEERYSRTLASYAPTVLGPVIEGSTIVVVGVRSQLSGVAGIYGYDLATGTQRYFIPYSEGAAWTPAAANGFFYGVVEGFSSFNSETGARTTNFPDLRAQLPTTPILGGANRLYTQSFSRLAAVDIVQQRVVWDKPAGTAIPPVVGNGVVYSIIDGTIVARSESDGAELWNWKPVPRYPALQSMLLTNNLLFVSTASADPRAGQVFAIDLATRKTVWSHPFPGMLSLGSDGSLYIEQFGTIAAISLK